MAGKENLRPPKSTEEARERGRKGGIKSGEVRRERKALKEELLLLLSEGDTQKAFQEHSFQKLWTVMLSKQDVALGGIINGVILVELINELEEWVK